MHVLRATFHMDHIPDGFDARLEVIRRSETILTQVDG